MNGSENPSSAATFFTRTPGCRIRAVARFIRAQKPLIRADRVDPVKQAAKIFATDAAIARQLRKRADAHDAGFENPPTSLITKTAVFRSISEKACVAGTND